MAAPCELGPGAGEAVGEAWVPSYQRLRTLARRPRRMQQEALSDKTVVENHEIAKSGLLQQIV